MDARQLNQITQYRPAFFDTDWPIAVQEFDSLDELLRIPWVKSWAALPRFFQFSYDREAKLLMAEYEKPEQWWVVGSLRNPVDLPEWKWRPRGQAFSGSS